MAEFQAYQAAFTAHLRHPSAHSKPTGVNAKRMRIYREIVFNNFFASVSACFPVLLGILGKRRFSKLVRQCFFAEHFHSPLFKDIPGSFVHFLQSLSPSTADLPVYTAQLAHYEWIELVLSRQVDITFADSLTEHAAEEADVLLHRVVQLNTVHRLLQYDFPVHQLSPKNNAIAPAPTFLLVYRMPTFEIRFIQLNAVTFQLLQQLQTSHQTVHQHLQHLAQTMPQLALASVMEFGLQTLHSLHQQHAIRAVASLE